MDLAVSARSDRFNDLRKHRRDRAKQHEAAARVFRNRSNRERGHRARGREQDGRGIHHVLSVGLPLRKSRRVRGSDCGGPRHQ